MLKFRSRKEYYITLNHKKIMTNFFKFFDLQNGEEDKTVVLENVKSNILFHGSNLWVLACAIVIASVGLNVNSPAAIIGAMLISPLMSPIVGAGFSLGIYDFDLLKKSLSNLLRATILGLLVSALYFYLSPFKEVQSELLARTSPTIYDVLIAFFGGLVGVIAITRKEKGNPIPGVAIATALMPPLCTAGYGLATGDMSFLFGALFLYTINCVFICISTFFIVKYLKYPSYKYVNPTHQTRIKYIIYAVVLALIIPSTFFAYRLLKQKKFTYKVENFIDTEFNAKGYAMVIKNIETNSNPKKIELAFLNKKFSVDDIKELNKKLVVFGINDAELIIKQDTTDIKNAILSEIRLKTSNINQKDVRIAQLEQSIKDSSYDNSTLLGELVILFPEIKSVSMANHTFYQNTDSMKIVPIMVYKSTKELSTETKQKMSLWLAKRLNKPKVEIFSE
jgi:uncharacterized hydrophobic protein (TIGR00271 family)